MASSNMYTDAFSTSGSAPTFGGIPPPQAAAGEDLQITFDTEMIDEDEAIALQQQQQQQQQQQFGGGGFGGGGGVQGDGNGGMEVDTVGLAREKIHLRGVDSMATADIEAWERGCTGDVVEGGLKRVEWIDDSSCNLIYHSPQAAVTALNLLIVDPAEALYEGGDPLVIRRAKPAGSHPDARLEVRVARVDDQKQKGARERSRFYLFNPEYDRGEEFERRRKEGRRGGRRGGDRDRERDASPNDPDRGYQRRFYDKREHDRRLDGAGFDDNMYDDARPAAGSASSNSLHPRPRQTTSHSRSRSRNRDRARSRSRSRSQSRGGARGFRDRSYDGAHQYRRRRSPPPPQRREKATIELFPEALGRDKTGGLMAHHGDAEGGAGDKFYNPPAELIRPTLAGGVRELLPGKGMRGSELARVGGKGIELFPEKAAAPGPAMGKSILGLAERSNGAGNGATRELFPTKSSSSQRAISPAAPQSRPATLEARITIPGFSSPLPARGGILGFNNTDSELLRAGGELDNDDEEGAGRTAFAGVSRTQHLHGVAPRGEDDLFAQKMAQGRRIGLSGGGGGGDLMDRIEAPNGGGGGGGKRRGRRRAADMFS